MTQTFKKWSAIYIHKTSGLLFSYLLQSFITTKLLALQPVCDFWKMKCFRSHKSTMLTSSLFWTIFKTFMFSTYQFKILLTPWLSISKINPNHWIMTLVLHKNKYQFNEFLKQRSSFIVIGILWSKQYPAIIYSAMLLYFIANWHFLNVLITNLLF